MKPSLAARDHCGFDGGRRARFRPAKVFFASIRVECFEGRVIVIVAPLAVKLLISPAGTG
jgi:hypothetical protein